MVALLLHIDTYFSYFKKKFLEYFFPYLKMYVRATPGTQLVYEYLYIRTLYYSFIDTIYAKSILTLKSFTSTKGSSRCTRTIVPATNSMPYFKSWPSSVLPSCSAVAVISFFFLSSIRCGWVHCVRLMDCK